MSERHEKWQRVEPGTVIPAGQPYRFENVGGFAFENIGSGLRAGSADGGEWFIDSSWKPPLVLPTEPTWGFPMQGGCEQNVGQWMVQDNVFEDLSGTRLSVSSVTDFIELTPEQVARIEQAR